MNLGKSAKNTGTFIAPEDWDDFISNEDVKLIDVRNFYETVIGKFLNLLIQIQKLLLIS